MPSGRLSTPIERMTVDHRESNFVEKAVLTGKRSKLARSGVAEGHCGPSKQSHSKEDRQRRSQRVPKSLVRLSLDSLVPDDGAPEPSYLKAVDNLYLSLIHYGAVVIELPSSDTEVLRQSLAASRLFFKCQKAVGSGRHDDVQCPDSFTYRAGR